MQKNETKKKRVTFRSESKDKIEYRFRNNQEMIQDICVAFTQNKMRQFYLENEGKMRGSPE